MDTQTHEQFKNGQAGIASSMVYALMRGDTTEALKLAIMGIRRSLNHTRAQQREFVTKLAAAMKEHPGDVYGMSATVAVMVHNALNGMPRAELANAVFDVVTLQARELNEATARLNANPAGRPIRDNPQA